MTIDKPTLPSGNRRRKALLGATLAFLLIGVAAVLYYMLVLSQEEETDNAYIGGNLVMLTSQVTGNVQEIRADETQLVNAGAEVIKLDAVDADVTLRQAQARLGAIVLQLREKYANAVQYEAVLQQRKLTLKKVEDDLGWRAPLGDDHTLSAEEVPHAKQAVDDAKAALNVAVEQVKTAQAALGGTTLAQHPAVLAAKEDFVQAWLAARRNAILAPVSGYVAKRSVQVGAHVSPGMALLSIVPLDQLWVDANFKESELQNIRIGQPVTVEADIYGGKVTYHGNVVGLSAGTGSAFSLLPAQNASGNWIKVVQRLPVRIALDSKELAEHPLRVGLSATVTVDTHRRDGAVLGAAMPSVPVYATQSLGQLVQDADKMADTVIAKNIAK